MAATSLSIELHVLADNAEFGQWCETCALPSAVTVEVLMVNSDTLRVMGRTTATVCQSH
jgi:hypothetical protein